MATVTKERVLELLKLQKDEIIALKSALAQAEKRADESLAEKDNAERYARENEERLKCSEIELDALKDRNGAESLEGQVRALQEKEKELKGTVVELKLQAQKEKLSRDELMERVSELENGLAANEDQLRSENEKLKLELESERLNRAALLERVEGAGRFRPEVDVENVESSNRALEETVKLLEGKLAEMEKTNDAQLGEISELKSQLEVAGSNLLVAETIQKETKLSSESSQQRLEELQKEIESLRLESSSLSERNAILEQSVNGLNEELTSVSNEEAMEKLELIRSTEEAQTEIAQLREQLEELKMEKDAAQNFGDAKEEELTKLREHAGILQSKLDLVEADLTAALSKVTVTEEKNVELSNRVALLEGNMNELQSSGAVLEAQLQDTIIELHASVQRSEELESNIEKAKSAASEFESKLAEEESKVVTANEKRLAIESKLLEAESEIVSLTEKLKTNEAAAHARSSDLETQLASMESQKSQSQEQLSAFVASAEMAALEQAGSLKQAKVELSTALEKVSLLETKVAELEEERMRNLKEHSAALDEMRHAVNKKDDLVAQFEADVSSRDLHCQSLEASKDQLTTQVLDLENQIRILSSTIEGYERGEFTWNTPLGLDDLPVPPVGIDHPVIQTIFSHWTKDPQKAELVNNWCTTLASSNGLPSRNKLELNQLNLEVVQGFTQMIIPILRAARPDLTIQIRTKPIVSSWSLRISAEDRSSPFQTDI